MKSINLRIFYIIIFPCRLGLRGVRTLAVAKTVPGNVQQWEFLGLLTFLDPPRADTKQVLSTYEIYVTDITVTHKREFIVFCLCSCSYIFVKIYNTFSYSYHTVIVEIK